jgi:hypothetical protein
MNTELSIEQINKIENAYLEALKQAPAELFIGMAIEGLEKINQLRSKGEVHV